MLPLLLALFISSCEKSKTISKASSEFITLAEKQEFLEQYIMFRRRYDELHYNLSYIDGASGMVPGPTEWNIRIFAVVPAGELDQWVDRLSVIADPELDWVSDIPNAPADLGGYKWYRGRSVIVGIDRESRTVLYRSHAY